MFEGSIVALVTPFRHGRLDEQAVRGLIQYHIRNGTNGILVAGCTGEAANLSPDELRMLISLAQEETSRSDRKIWILAGTGSNSTAVTLERTKIASEMLVDGVLLITPYYNKPTPAGQIEHYRKVADSTPLPVILYNVPGRTGVNMLPETIAELSRIDNIVAIKEAGGDVDQVSRIRLLSGITVLSGDDTLTLPMMAVGASGVVSVTANIDPAGISGMCAAWKNGDIETARQLHLKLFPLSKAMFIETNPMPVKAALEMMNLIVGELRLPLVPVKPESRETIRKALVAAGLMNQVGE
ncbi:4-hydroxy-tetrahydrodipicolinate synthase [bacterium]|nr:4-hydroxy-tetrahydrodipicolinate synthase [candidate division CSSED10-310 bacterium]